MGNILNLILAKAGAIKPCCNYKLHLTFQHASLFLTNREIINLLCLNKCFHTHFPNDKVLTTLILNLLSTLFQISFNTETAIDCFKNYTGIDINTINDIARICRNPKNLLKNPYGANGYNFWERRDGGDGWKIENSLTFNNNRSCYVASNRWCTLSTIIDLKPFIRANNQNQALKLFVGSPVARRSDCGAIAKLDIEVKNKSISLASYEQLLIPTFIQLSNTRFSGVWQLLSTVIDIEPTAEQVILKFMGRDDQNWAGNYGARFGYLFAIILYD